MIMAVSAATLLASLAALPAARAAPPSPLLAAAESIAPWIKSVRRELHKIPELLFEVHKSRAALQ